MRRHALVAVAVLLMVTAGCVADSGGGPTTGPGSESDVEGALTVHAIDVGQADATLVIGPTGETMLVDSGDWRDDGETVLAYLEAHGIERIDHLVATHGHADHIGGHDAVIEHYETEGEGVGAVYDSGVAHSTKTYEEYLDAVETHDVTLYEVQAGDEIPMEGVDATVYNPPVDRETDDRHDNSVALRLAFGETSVLFTGDAEANVEERLVEAYGDDLRSTVYFAGHHGSATSSSEEFLTAVDPKLIAVSSAHDSEYGHPHDETLDRLDAQGSAVVWTAVHGTTVLESDGETVAVRTQTEATTDPLELTDAPPSDADPSDPVENRTTVAAERAVALPAAPQALTVAVAEFEP